MTDLANGQVSVKELAEMFVTHRSDCEYCPECFAVFVWDKLPDENVIMATQHHPYGSTTAAERMFVGWICPNCGAKIVL